MNHSAGLATSGFRVERLSAFLSPPQQFKVNGIFFSTQFMLILPTSDSAARNRSG
jgi:hypothetical protein